MKSKKTIGLGMLHAAKSPKKPLTTKGVASAPSPLREKTKPIAKKSTTVKKRAYAEIVDTALNAFQLSDDIRAQIRAMVGIDGYCENLLACDQFVRDEIVSHLIAYVARMDPPKPGMQRVAFAISDNCGLTSIERPFLYSKALYGRTRKIAKLLSVDAMATITHRVVNAGPKKDDRSLMLSVRGVGYMPAGIDVETAMQHVERARIVLTTAVPKISITMVDSEQDFQKEMRRMLAIPSKVYQPNGEGHSMRMAAITAVPSPAEVLRQMDAIAQLPNDHLLFSLGRRFAPVVKAVRGKVRDSQGGRVETGTVLPPTFDPWILSSGICAAVGPSHLPARTDMPTKSPPRPKRPKRPKMKNKKNRRSGTIKIGKRSTDAAG